MKTAIQPAPHVTCIGREDEMITLHAAGSYAATLYASCPEQAADFVEAHGRCKLASVDSWRDVLTAFKNRWKSKYPDES